jgi:hypothetical protein
MFQKPIGQNRKGLTGVSEINAAASREALRGKGLAYGTL